MRTATSLTLEESVLGDVKRSRGPASVSERVNQLLKRALLEERYARLEQEAAAFFSSPPAAERREGRSWQRAARRTLARD
jgi:hypothetical protein